MRARCSIPHWPFPVLVLSSRRPGLFAGIGPSILVWALITVTCYAGLALLARRVDQTDPADIDPGPPHRWLLLGHVASGLGWAYFASLECQAPARSTSSR
jgi:two-component system, cell cycle sensor histidine kinase PleC